MFFFPRRRNYRRSNLSQREIHDCYYAGTAKGVGNNLNPDMSEVTTAYFGTTSWPVDDPSKGWGIGDDYEKGMFWNSLGGYVSGRPTYPTLSWTAAAAAAVDRTIDRAAVVTHTATAPQQAADPLRSHR